MALIRNGEIVADPWRRITNDAPLPAGGDVVVSFDRLLSEGKAIAARPGKTGAALPNSADVAEFAELLPYIELVVLDFPAFTDGRAYSQARLLRAKHGFKGELRASGNVLADQAAFMARVGFDSFEVEKVQALDVWINATRSMSLVYQRGYEGSAATRHQPWSA